MSNAIMMDGYYKNQQATQDCFIDKYMTVGDVAVRDHEGYIYIVDRVKDMIIRGRGEHISGGKWRRCCAKCQASGMQPWWESPTRNGGEVVVAFVVAEPEAPPTFDEIKAYCLEPNGQP